MVAHVGGQDEADDPLSKDLILVLREALDEVILLFVQDSEKLRSVEVFLNGNII